MEYSKRVVPKSGAAIFTFTILLCLSVCLPKNVSASQISGVIVDFKEEVVVFPPQSTMPTPATINQELDTGSTVRTNNSGWGAVLLADETLVQISRNTDFFLKEVALGAEWHNVGQRRAAPPASPHYSSYDLKKGRIWLRNNNKNFRLEINTPTVSAAIRGTEVEINMDPEGTVFITVLEGTALATNTLGQLSASATEQIIARPGMPLTKTVLVSPQDAVQWTVVIPTLLINTSEYNASAEIQKGYTLILQKRFQEAQQVLAGIIAHSPNDATAHSLYAITALLQNDKETALKEAQLALTADPESTLAWLVESQVQQASFRIDLALDAAEKALSLDSGNIDALLAVAKLKFAGGFTEEAEVVILKAKETSSNNADVSALQGFIGLARQDSGSALKSFHEAIELQPGNGEAHMGLALTLMRQGKTGEAMEKISRAALLEPQRSLFLSYWAKMLYQVGRLQPALDVLEHAIVLDPKDPTPHLYKAIIQYDWNQLPAALSSINQAVALNDNRAVYRSRFLLDQDAALRSVDQSILYNSLGLTDLGRYKALESVKTDYANPSGHVFLAGSYGALEGRLRANTTELLLGMLLQPANVNAMNTFQQYTSFFEQPNFSGTVFGTLGNRENGGSIIITGNIPSKSLSYNSMLTYSDSQGWRDTDFRRSKGLHALFKWDASSKDGFLVDFAYSFYTKGDQNDAPFEYDAEIFPDDWLEDDLRYVTLGYHHHFGPNNDILLSFRHQRATIEFFSRTSGFWPFDQTVYLFTDSTDHIQAPHDQLQVHYLHKFGQHQLIGGALHFSQKKTADSLLIDEAYFLFGGDVYFLDTVRSTYNANGRQYFSSLYIQDIWTISPTLSLEAALYYDIMDNENVFTTAKIEEKRLNPRLGLAWKPSGKDTIRLAAFSSLVPPVLQRLDPPDVAGIIVSRNSFEGTYCREAAFSWEHEFAAKAAFLSIAVYKQKNEVTEKWPDNQRQTSRGELSGVEAAWNQLFLSGIGLRVSGQTRNISNEASPSKDRQDYITTLSLNYLHPSGLFAGASQTYRYDNMKNPGREGEDIFITDLAFGYKFPKKKGEFTLEARNLFDNHFNWIVDDFVFTSGRMPRFEIGATLSLFF